ncbi:DUF3883 domain-containing protein [Burkholderia ubonensis]|uniref:DUF3883 domain-containing protein n=1 Tax=Burkholderia ubonensis TaxID=101571 RepID=UPI0005D9C349|nr:DUF3883 domain-containing protein [Burkholderia ubonensis]AJX17047.1 hypothetical protein BW23_1710 [Burkholderia ubonensis MSMB22]
MLNHSQYADWIIEEISKTAPTQLVSIKKTAGNKLQLTMNVGGHELSFRILLFAVGAAGRTNPLERRVEITTTYNSGFSKLPNSVDVIIGVERDKRLLVGIDSRRLDYGGATHNASTFVYLPSFQKLDAGGWLSMRTASQLFDTEYQVYFVPTFLLEYLKQHELLHKNGVATVLANVSDSIVDESDHLSVIGSEAKLSYEQQVEIAMKKMQVGRIGESLVLQYEKARLKKAGVKSLSQKVRWVSQSQPYLGFDIATVNIKSKDEYIEVKSSTSKLRTFYFTSNEMRVAEKKGNAYRLICVSNVMTQPSINEIRNPMQALNDGLLTIESGTHLVRVKGSQGT